METKFSVKLLSNLPVTMDKKPNKDIEKKAERVKDRGDLRKTNNSKPNMEVKDFMPDRGDTQITNLKSTSKPNIEKKKQDESKRSSDVLKKDLSKKESPVQNRTYLDLEGRKCLRERYTLKFKSKNSDVKVETKETDNKSGKKTDDESTIKDGESSKNSVYTEPKTDKKPVKEAPCSQRKPIIKTVTVKNDNRVYKAVTFVDQKHHTPLRINIPNEYKKKPKEPSVKVKLKPSKESIKEKPVKKVVKKRGKKTRVLSPELNSKRNASPPTEVAKWVPSCLNHHTKPYYEAWVDTTLAAITKCSKNDKLYFEKQNIIQTFKRALLERPETPDLVHKDYTDERYTGKIKVRQR